MFNLSIKLIVSAIIVSIGLSEATVDNSKIDLSIYKLRPVEKTPSNRFKQSVTHLAEASKALSESLFVLKIKSRCSSFGYLFKLIKDGEQLRREDITNLAVVTTVEYQNFRKRYEQNLPELKNDFINTVQELEDEKDIGEFRNTWRDLIFCLIDDYSSQSDVKAFLLNPKRAKEINTLNEFKSVPTTVIPKGSNPDELAPLGYVKTIVEMIESRNRGENIELQRRHEFLSDSAVAESILDTGLFDDDDDTDGDKETSTRVQTLVEELEKMLKDQTSSDDTTNTFDDIRGGTVGDLVSKIEEIWVGTEQEKTKTKAQLYIELMKIDEMNLHDTYPEQQPKDEEEHRAYSKINSFFGRSKKMDSSLSTKTREPSLKLDQIRPPEPIVVSQIPTSEIEMVSNDGYGTTSDGQSDSDSDDNMGNTISDIILVVSKPFPTALEDSLLNMLSYIRFRLLMQPSRFGLARLDTQSLVDWVEAFDDLNYQRFGRISNKAKTFLHDETNKEIDDRIRNAIAIKAQIDAVLIDMKKTHDTLTDLNDLKNLVTQCGHLLALLDPDIDVDDLRRVYNIWSAKYTSYEVTQRLINSDGLW